MELINLLAEQYAARHTTALPVLQQEVYDYTIANHPESQMISGPVQGKLLSMISQILRPARILEIGTFTGFSALCLATGLQPLGQLHTIEYREADAETAGNFFKKSDFKDQIILHIGDAREIIPTLDIQWDLVFIDADKTSYITYYNQVLPRLSKQGIILADNVLFHGQVLEETIKGKNAIAIDEFNRLVAADPATEQVMLTVRDGLMLIRKKQNVDDF